MHVPGEPNEEVLAIESKSWTPVLDRIALTFEVARAAERRWLRFDVQLVHTAGVRRSPTSLGGGDMQNRR